MKLKYSISIITKILGIISVVSVIFIIISLYIFMGGSGNKFHYDKYSQKLVAESTYLGTMYVKSNGNYYLLKRKGEKRKKLHISDISKYYYIINLEKGDTLNFLIFKLDSIYEFEHVKIRDAKSYTVQLTP